MSEAEIERVDLDSMSKKKPQKQFEKKWKHDKAQERPFRQFKRQQQQHQFQRPQNSFVVQISNLHYSVTTEDLEEIASKYGKVKKCFIEWDSQGRSAEAGKIEYYNEGDARRAANNLNGTLIESQPLRARVFEQRVRRPM